MPLPRKSFLKLNNEWLATETEVDVFSAAAASSSDE